MRQTAPVSREVLRRRQRQIEVIVRVKTMSCNYGLILPPNSLSNRNGIGRSHMGDWVGRSARHQINFPDRQPLAELQQPRCGEHILPSDTFAQEVDVEVGGDRQDLPGRSPRAARHTWRNRQAPSAWDRKSFRPDAASGRHSTAEAGMRRHRPPRSLISSALKACGNSLRRNVSSSGTVIFAMAMFPRLPSPHPAYYIKLVFYTL